MAREISPLYYSVVADALRYIASLAFITVMYVPGVNRFASILTLPFVAEE